MDWILPDISIILATILLIFVIFLAVGSRLRVKEAFFQLWVLAWLLSIVHYGGQLVLAGAGVRWGAVVDRTFLAYSAITFILAAASLRGHVLRPLLPYAAAAAVLFTGWTLIEVYRLSPRFSAQVPLGPGLGLAFGTAGVLHWIHQRKQKSFGGMLLAYSFFFWAGCFLFLVAMKGSPFVSKYIQYIYQFSNLPKPVAAISMLIFLLEREKASVQRERDFSDKLIENAPDGIFIAGPDLGIVSVNKRFEALTGLTAEELTGRQVGSLSPADEAQAHQSKLAAVLRGETVSYESRIALEDGTTRDVLITSTPVTEGGTIIGAMGIVKDVTERLYLEQQLRQAEKMASIGLMVSGVAHELNNPLTSVIGYTELALQGGQLGETAAHRMKIVLSEAKRTRNIVQRLLSAVRQQKRERVPVHVNQIIRETIALREHDFRMNGVSVRTELARNVPMIVADAADIQQVLINLMQNALDAIGEAGRDGAITVRSGCVEDCVLIEVSDDGPGLADPQRVFDPFYTTKEVGKGTGLGLSICYQLVKGLGGEISAQNLARGARFTIKLSAADVTHVPGSVELGHGASFETHSRVLVVDDEPTILALSKECLLAEGFAVDTASSGAEAIRKLSTSSFDVIVTDYRMPEKISGGDLYDWIRSNRPGHESRVIFVTGDAVNPDTYRFLQRTGNPVLLKPFDNEQLIAKVKAAAGGGRLGPPPQASPRLDEERTITDARSEAPNATRAEGGEG